MTTTLELQQRLHALGLYKGDLDGKYGPMTMGAMSAALDKLASTMPKPQIVVDNTKPAPPVLSSKFDAGSAKRLAAAHPLIQKLMNAARERIAFTVMDSQRGRAEQELAVRRGNSKAHFGDSAHNWSPAIAVDIAPVPLDWNDIASFRALQAVIGWYHPASKAGHGLAKEMEIPIRWGGDWNMNGKADEKLVDMPHYELTPWRSFAAQCRPYEG